MSVGSKSRGVKSTQAQEPRQRVEAFAQYPMSNCWTNNLS